MKLYYTPGACSLAPHIVARELGIDIELILVDLATKRTDVGDDFTLINAKGSVPTLLIDGGILTETSVILAYLADLKPGAELIPQQDSFARYRVQEVLNFIATEVHKTLGLLFNPLMPPEAKKVALSTANKKLDYLESQLEGREYLVGTYSTADAYAFTILNWTGMLDIDLGQWPRVAAYVARIGARPAVRAALVAEGLIPAPAETVAA